MLFNNQSTLDFWHFPKISLSILMCSHGRVKTPSSNDGPLFATRFDLFNGVLPMIRYRVGVVGASAGLMSVRFRMRSESLSWSEGTSMIVTGLVVARVVGDECLFGCCLLAQTRGQVVRYGWSGIRSHGRVGRRLCLGWLPSSSLVSLLNVPPRITSVGREWLFTTCCGTRGAVRRCLFSVVDMIAFDGVAIGTDSIALLFESTEIRRAFSCSILASNLSILFFWNALEVLFLGARIFPHGPRIVKFGYKQPQS